MEKTGLTSNFRKHILIANGWLKENRFSRTALEFDKWNQILCVDLHEAANNKDIDTMLIMEGILLENDLENFTNSPAMKGSLDMAMLELQATVSLVDQVRSPERYKEIDQGYSLPKNRTGGVPKDEARQFFRSHAARLLNQDRSRLSDTEKQILDQRRTNIRAAEKIYKTMQETALGITQGHNRGKASTITP